MNAYRELRERHQKEFDEANLLGFAFGDKQFKELMQKWGINPDNEEEMARVRHVMAGAYILVENIPAYKEMNRKHQEEFEAAVNADQTGEDFIYQMFYCELCNHEFGYTYDPEDALDALGYSADDVNNDKRLNRGFTKACQEIMGEEE